MVAAVASRWRHCAPFERPGNLTPELPHLYSIVVANELTRKPKMKQKSKEAYKVTLYSLNQKVFQP